LISINQPYQSKLGGKKQSVENEKIEMLLSNYWLKNAKKLLKRSVAFKNKTGSIRNCSTVHVFKILQKFGVLIWPEK